jgi:hypothetical protein
MDETIFAPEGTPTPVNPVTVGGIRLTEDEQTAGLEATYEIESISRHLNRHLAMESDDAFMRALVVRVHALNGVLMSILGDDDRDLAKMKAVVAGV